jgi:phosphoadenosine phosphosulfate reductase
LTEFDWRKVKADPNHTLNDLVVDVEPILHGNLFADTDKVNGSVEARSIAIMREYEPEEGYWLAFSGGKDSVVLYDLAVRSGVKFDAHYNLTTIDPPELVQFIKREYPHVAVEKPKHSFWWYVRHNYGLPFRTVRWCCRELKERGGQGRKVLSGVRAEESNKRAGYGIVTPCQKADAKGKVMVSPILHWKTTDVWGYIHARQIPYCCLYDQGWKRIGCVLCPNNTQAETDRAVERYPKLFAGLLKAMRVSYPNMPSWNREGWNCAEDVLADWLDRTKSYPTDSDEQMMFDQFGDDE